MCAIALKNYKVATMDGVGCGDDDDMRMCSESEGGSGGKEWDVLQVVLSEKRRRKV